MQRQGLSLGMLFREVAVVREVEPRPDRPLPIPTVVRPAEDAVGGLTRGQARRPSRLRIIRLQMIRR